MFSVFNGCLWVITVVVFIILIVEESRSINVSLISYFQIWTQDCDVCFPTDNGDISNQPVVCPHLFPVCYTGIRTWSGCGGYVYAGIHNM